MYSGFTLIAELKGIIQMTFCNEGGTGGMSGTSLVPLRKQFVRNSFNSRKPSLFFASPT